MLYEVITRWLFSDTGLGGDRLWWSRSAVEGQLLPELEMVAAQAVELFQLVDGHTVFSGVITSYSIHYTKLYEVRPESYVEINNFYTATVYNKGGESYNFV